jgi:hypothetical protein
MPEIGSIVVGEKFLSKTIPIKIALEIAPLLLPNILNIKGSF